MFIPQSWVTKIVHDPENIASSDWFVTPNGLSEDFARVGFEAEGYESLEKVEGPLVLDYVDHVEEFEGLKRLIRPCQISVGDANGTDELQEIICGVCNFEEGSIVAVALPGCALPGDFEASARKAYGRIPNGMLCSEAELGMTDSSVGILTLPLAPAKLGSCAEKFVGLDEEKSEVNITPDRDYALSAHGLDHKICSVFNLDFADPAKAKGLSVEGETLNVTIDEDTDTHRFDLRRVTGIDPNAETPWWMRRRLLLVDQRPVSVATNVTSYVMLLLGRPMHTFDGSKIAGGLHIRNAKAGETLTTLDHMDHELNLASVVICGDSGTQSLADITGGLTSEIADDTIGVVLEAAN